MHLFIRIKLCTCHMLSEYHFHNLFFPFIPSLNSIPNSSPILYLLIYMIIFSCSHSSTMCYLYAVNIICYTVIFTMMYFITFNDTETKNLCMHLCVTHLICICLFSIFYLLGFTCFPTSRSLHFLIQLLFLKFPCSAWLVSSF